MSRPGSITSRWRRPPDCWRGHFRRRERRTLVGGQGNGNDGDGAVPRFQSRADAGDARCRSGIGLFDSNSPAGICISFESTRELCGRRSPPLWNSVQYSRRNIHRSVAAAPTGDRGV